MRGFFFVFLFVFRSFFLLRSWSRMRTHQKMHHKKHTAAAQHHMVAYTNARKACVILPQSINHRTHNNRPASSLAPPSCMCTTIIISLIARTQHTHTFRHTRSPANNMATYTVHAICIVIYTHYIEVRTLNYATHTHTRIKLTYVHVERITYIHNHRGASVRTLHTITSYKSHNTRGHKVYTYTDICCTVSCCCIAHKHTQITTVHAKIFVHTHDTCRAKDPHARASMPAWATRLCAERARTRASAACTHKRAHTISNISYDDGDGDGDDGVLQRALTRSVYA